LVRTRLTKARVCLQVQLSKEVRRVRKFEKNFLAHYRKFVELLKSIMSMKKPNPIVEEGLDTASSHAKKDVLVFHVNTTQALRQVHVIAIKALGKVLLSNPSFNFGELLLLLLPHLTSEQARTCWM
jgi:hypothetical protein